MEKFNYKSCDHQLLQKKRPTRIVTTCPLIINLIPTLKGIEQIPTCPIVVLLGGPQPSILCKYVKVTMWKSNKSGEMSHIPVMSLIYSKAESSWGRKMGTRTN